MFRKTHFGFNSHAGAKNGSFGRAGARRGSAEGAAALRGFGGLAGGLQRLCGEWGGGGDLPATSASLQIEKRGDKVRI